MAGMFADAITGGGIDTLTNLYVVMQAVDPTCELHVAEISITGDDLNTAATVIGGPRLDAANPPVNGFKAITDSLDSYTEGAGNTKNTIHLTDFKIISHVANQKLHIKTRVV